MIRLLASLLVLVPWLLSVTPSWAQAAPSGCQFILGFKTLHDLDPADVGDCVDNQAFAANGDAQQHTTAGLMAWRKADNWTAFTNGYSTWINGPYGLAKRLNAQRFAWEANPDGLPVISSWGAAVASPPVAAPALDTGPTRPADAASADVLPQLFPNDDPAWAQAEAAKFPALGGVPLRLTIYPWSIPNLAAKQETVNVTVDDAASTSAALLAVPDATARPFLTALLTDAKARWPGGDIDVEFQGTPYYSLDPLVGQDWIFQGSYYTGRGWLEIQGYGRAYHWQNVGSNTDDILWRPTAAAPAGGIVCNDGTISHAAHTQGACSHHGGISH